MGDRMSPRPTAGATRPDDGFTFVEVLVTIVLIGTVVLALLAGTQTLIVTSRVSREAAHVESALLNAADRLERADRAAFKCDLDGIVRAAAQTSFGLSSAEVAPYYDTDQWYFDLNGNRWINAACPDGNSNGSHLDDEDFQPGLVQKVIVTMVSPDNGLTRTLEVVKGDV